jgi:hypothetical protein
MTAEQLNDLDIIVRLVVLPPLASIAELLAQVIDNMLASAYDYEDSKARTSGERQLTTSEMDEVIMDLSFPEPCIGF